MKNNLWLLFGLLISATLSVGFAKEPAQPANEDVVKSIFMDGLPVPYQLQRSGLIEENRKTSGFYVFLTNPETKSKVILLDLRQISAQSSYLKDDFLSLSKTLWLQYGGLSISDVQVAGIKSSFPQHQLANLKLSFSGHSELGLIGRLKYSNERYVIVMLRNPQYSLSLWESEETPLRREANELLVSVRSNEKLLPSERLILWRLRQIFKRNLGHS